ncbi:MAG: OstA-like protein [Bacteroidales bacterium]
MTLREFFQLLNKSKFCSLFIIAALVLFPELTLSQEKPQKIEILNANSLEYDENIHPNVRRFIGDVIFEHNDFTMYCDSAYYYTIDNQIDAFSNVHIERGDTLHLYGDFLSYNGNTNFGKIRENVELKDQKAQVFTDSLDFYAEEDYAHYFDGGKIINEDNTITSKTAHYYSSKKMAYFNEDVTIENPDYMVDTDTLNYDTEEEIAYFIGPTDIYNDSSYLYCEEGWYKTQSNQFLFTKNAMYQKEERIIKGDTLFYDREANFGQIKQSAEIIDTLQNIILKGNYSEYSENPDRAFLTDETLMIHVDNENDSLFLHADTIKSHYDSTESHQIFKAYYKVKFFKTNLQGKCDSLSYYMKDSTIRMYYEPIMWSDSNQIFADDISIQLKDNEVDEFFLDKNALIISQQDEDKFNQIKGKQMTGYVKNNEIRRVDVDGNGETIYYTVDKNEIIGVNKAISSNLIIKLRDNQVERINMINSPGGTLYPLGDLEETKLKGFQWLEQHRPRKKSDIFIW